jgi:hypothetical protein
MDLFGGTSWPEEGEEPGAGHHGNEEQPAGSSRVDQLALEGRRGGIVRTVVGRRVVERLGLLCAVEFHVASDAPPKPMCRAGGLYASTSAFSLAARARRSRRMMPPESATSSRPGSVVGQTRSMKRARVPVGIAVSSAVSVMA